MCVCARMHVRVCVCVHVCVHACVGARKAGNVFLDIFLQKRHADSKY